MSAAQPVKRALKVQHKPLKRIHGAADKHTAVPSDSSNSVSSHAHCNWAHSASHSPAVPETQFWWPTTPSAEEASQLGSWFKEPLGRQNTKAVKAATQIFIKNLIRIQPLVICPPSIHEASLTLLEEAARRSPELAAALQSSCGDLLSASAAAFWICAKFTGVRTSSPNGLLMSQACQVDVQKIISMEIMLLNTLSWDVAAVLRHRGIPLC